MKFLSAKAIPLLKRVAVPVARDVIGLGGFAMFDRGVAMVSPALGWMVAGLGLVMIAALLARRP
jgi:hypothetical protein